MSRHHWILLVAIAIAAAGCNRSSDTAAPVAEAAEANETHTHHDDHEQVQDHDHDHDHVAQASLTAGGAAVPPAGASRESAGGSRYGALPPEVSPSSPALEPDAPPDVVVKEFLAATRDGNDQLAARLLSDKALAETTRMGLAVKPPGTPTMTYEVQDVEYPADTENGAYVHSRWTERFGDSDESYRISWILRRQSDGWRIVGMAAELSDTEPPYLLNFEDPRELYEQLHESGESLAAPQSPDDVPRTAAAPPAPLR